ncbi:MAG: amidohydrolase [Bacteroidetes bacterium]|nr:MAG: amidohydrolase [Bacteroidota bacterium]
MIPKNLKISIIQSELHWQNPSANLAMFEEKIWQIKESDLIVLPEMFTTGFSMNAEQFAEHPQTNTFRWLKQQAAQSQAVITGSYMIKENGKFYNRLFWVKPNGEFEQYDKRHLFRMAKEDQIYAEGTKLLITELKGWRICPLICYDLRFPVWSRNSKDFKYDCLIYVANFPEARMYAWNTLLRARAIENLSYCVGVNRVGLDGNEVAYSGESAVLNFRGEELFYNKNESVIQTIHLNYQDLQEFRAKFPANLDADDFSLTKNFNQET